MKRCTASRGEAVQVGGAYDLLYCRNGAVTPETTGTNAKAQGQGVSKEPGLKKWAHFDQIREPSGLTFGPVSP